MTLRDLPPIYHVENLRHHKTAIIRRVDNGVLELTLTGPGGSTSVRDIWATKLKERALQFVGRPRKIIQDWPTLKNQSATAVQ